MFHAKRLTALALAAAGILAAPVAAQPETDIDQCATYTIDSDTNRLLRYSFATDTFLEIGEVKTASGSILDDCESLTWVPHGMAKGLYTVPTKGTYERRLAKIDPLTARATVFSPTVVPGEGEGSGAWTDGRKVTGMVSYYDAVEKEWLILAFSAEDRGSDKTRHETRELVRIDPRDGTSTMVATQAMMGDGLRLESLGMDANGDLWGTSRTHLLRIHQASGYWVEEIGDTGLDKAEAFEIVTGDFTNRINIPDIPPGWTNNGVFMVNCENQQRFGVLNPADGEFREYRVDGNPSAFATEDAEGLVMLTLRGDPLYGSMVSGD